jgi:hypothetical protein
MLTDLVYNSLTCGLDVLIYIARHGACGTSGSGSPKYKRPVPLRFLRRLDKGRRLLPRLVIAHEFYMSYPGFFRSVSMLEVAA